MLVLALSCPATVKEKFLTCWTAGPELLPAFFRSPVILGIPAMALKTINMKEGRQYGFKHFNCFFIRTSLHSPMPCNINMLHGSSSTLNCFDCRAREIREYYWSSWRSIARPLLFQNSSIMKTANLCIERSFLNECACYDFPSHITSPHLL